MDVETAFLNAGIDEDIWVKIPVGTKLATNDDGIYNLRKPVYGLKQMCMVAKLQNTSW